MRNYVIINGVNSLTIQGLAIKTLPPITKPIQRTLREEIDGRDGDIVTTLGYGAYDKTIEIGLFGTFDIDEVIAYFNQKGTITFSNEADKVYYFEALDQVDYAELLKFRTANVVLHCQPFKYPLNETPLVEEYEYVEATGTNVTLDNTSEAIFNKIDLLGNTEQTQYTGKNKLLLQDKSSTTINGITYKVGNGIITLSGTSTTGTTIYFNSDLDTLNTLVGSQAILTREILSGTWNFEFDIGNAGAHYYWQIISAQTGTIASQAKNPLETLTISPHIYVGANKTLNCSFRVQAEAGGSFTSYEPYVGGVSSPNPNYPQDIHVVSGDNTIEITGRNLIDEAHKTNKWVNQNGTIVTATGSNCIKIKCQAGDKISTFATFATASAAGIIVVAFYDGNGNLLNRIVRGNGTKLTITGTAPANTSYAYAGHHLDAPTQIQVQRGEPTEYEPFTSQSLPLNLGVENLAQITATGSYNCTLSDGVFTSISYSGYGNIRPAITQITLPANKTIYYSADIRLKSGTSSGALNNMAIFGTTNTYTTNKLVNPNISSEFQRYIFSITPTIDEPAKGLLIQTNSGSSNAVIEIKNIMISYSYSNDFYEYGTTPIELCKIGNYQDYFGKSDGRNLFDKDKNIVEGYTFGNDDILISATDFFYQAYYIPVEPDTTYSFIGQKTLGSDSLRVCEYTSDKTFIQRNYELYTITTTQNTHYIRVSNYKDKLNTTQVEKGSSATLWQPYGVGKWYKYGAINYVMFDGSEDENWLERSSTSADYWKARYDGGLPTFITGRLDMITNYFVPNGGANDAGYSGNAICGNAGQYANWVHISIDNTIANSVASFRTWLSTHNLKVYYIQATPTNTEITYQSLIDQLNLLEKAMSKEGQTNISQTNSDMPFILNLSALKENSDHLVIDNIGNIYSKPTLDLEGTGIVDIYLNDTQMFEVDLSEKKEIVIDTEKMEAYNPTDNTLANRQVTGDYSKFKLNSGENDLRFSGDLTKATITNYERWL